MHLLDVRFEFFPQTSSSLCPLSMFFSNFESLSGDGLVGRAAHIYLRLEVLDKLARLRSPFGSGLKRDYLIFLVQIEISQR